jgi:hypothetical protein
MRVFLAICILSLIAVPAFAQDATKAERVELAKKLNEVNPVAKQVESSIGRVGASWGLAEKEKFQREMMAKIDIKKVEQVSMDALVDTFTKEELQAMLDYYSKPEAASIMQKMPVYQGLVQPGISREIDKALMVLRTGYESQQKAAPAPVPTTAESKPATP